MLTAPALASSVNDRTIQHVLEQEISTNSAFPQPNANSLYFLYLPPGVRGAGRLGILPGFLRVSQRHQRADLQQFDALTAASSP